MMVCGVLATVASSRYGHGRVSMMASATVHERASEHVYCVEEGLAKR
jgi:hypothetical protein